MSTTLVPTASPAVPDLIRTFLDGRSPHTLTAYGRDLDDFARFLTGSRQEALGRFFSQPAPAGSGDCPRNCPCVVDQNRLDRTGTSNLKVGPFVGP